MNQAMVLELNEFEIDFVVGAGFWGDLGKAIFAGVVGGAVAGGIAGSFAGGVGALPGAGIGGLAGGIGGGAAFVASEIWDYFAD